MCTTKTIVFAVALMSSILVIDGNDDERRQKQILVETINQNIDTPNLNMTLCVDKCAGENCKTYITPIDQCYSSSLLFPNDPSWSGKDLRDAIICESQTLVRTIFDTENGTCSSGSSEDKFRIPLNECVGPFGEPRPWGIFGLIQGQNKNVTIKK
jgi:hypothetical protein